MQQSVYELIVIMFSNRTLVGWKSGSIFSGASHYDRGLCKH